MIKMRGPRTSSSCPLFLVGDLHTPASWICLFLTFSEPTKDILSTTNNTNSYRSLFGVSMSFIHNKGENSIITFIKWELHHLEQILKWLDFQVKNKVLVALSSWWATSFWWQWSYKDNINNNQKSPSLNYTGSKHCHIRCSLLLDLVCWITWGKWTKINFVRKKVRHAMRGCNQVGH